MTQFAAHAWIEELLRRKLTGRMGPRPRRELRRWEQRDQKGERHHHQKMRSKRLHQLAMIEAKRHAARTLARRGNLYPSKRAILREIREAPHVYL